MVVWYFCNSVYPGLVFGGFRGSSVFLGVVVGFLMAFLAAESTSLFGAAICLLVAWFVAGVAGSSELLMVDGINVHSPWSSSIIFGDVVVLFLSLVSLRLVLNGITGFLGFPFLLSFPLSVIDLNGFLSEVGEADGLSVCFVDFVLDFWF